MAVQPPLRRDAQANRDRIVEAARSCFAAEGLGVPVEQIAQRAGVGMGTLYRRFPTKADLIDAVLEDAFEGFVAAASEALEAEDAWRGFSGFFEHAIALHAANWGLKDTMTTGARGKQHAESLRKRLEPLVEQLIERAQAQGTLRADFATEDVALVFWSAGRVIEASSEVAPELWRRQLGLMLDGLRAEAATPLPQPPLTRRQLDRVRERRRS
jgi:AcrR family transcriptional regulator